MTATKCTDRQIQYLAAKGASITEIKRTLHVDHRRIKRVAPDAGRHLTPAEVIEPYVREGYAHTQIAKLLHVAPARIRQLFPGSAWSKTEAQNLGAMVKRLERI